MMSDMPMMGGLLPSPRSVPRPPSMIAYLLAAILGTLAVTLLPLWIGQQVHEAGDRRQLVREAYERRMNTNELMMAITEAESAQRGYVITADVRFLGEFDAARRRANSDLIRASGTDTTIGDHGRRLAVLRRLIDDRFGEMATVIGLRRHQGLDAAVARIAEGRGVGLMSSTRDEVARLDQDEAELVRGRIAVLQARYVAFRQALIGLMLLVGLLLFTGLWALWRARAHRFALERNAHDTSMRLLALFAGNADATLMIDGRGRIEAANAAAKQLLGYGPGELAGRDIADLFDGQNDTDFPACIELVDDKVPKPYWPDRSVRHYAGHAVAVDIALGVMNLPDGQHVLMMMRDIAERKSVERLKDDFLATISHELRTPLTSVVGALGLLRKASADTLPDSASRLIEIAENNSRRLIRLVNDLLDIEKIGSGRMRFERAPLDLVAVADAAIDGVRGVADARMVRIERIAQHPPLIVQGDHDRLLQVLANLLSNAVRVSPAGGLVSVEVAQRDAQVVVTVDDAGPGIPEEFNGRIFERFAQASNGADGGSGLGLAISRDIVTAHDGRISFGRSPAGGARFSFTLPLSRFDEPLRGSQPCILVCEPDPVVARRLSAMLEAEDCAADCVATDHAVQSAVVSGRYDALLIDVALPEAGGLETLRALRTRAETRLLPVILVADAAFAKIADSDDPLLEPVDWIAKPVDQARLIASVRRAMAHSIESRPTLLHVDDDLDILEVTAGVLAEHGRVVHATSIASARAVLARQTPDVVILDLHLSDGSGSALLPDLLRTDGRPIPTILYSALDVPADLERKVDAVLIKSRRSLDSLAGAIQRILASQPQDAAVVS